MIFDSGVVHGLIFLKGFISVAHYILHTYSNNVHVLLLRCTYPPPPFFIRRRLPPLNLLLLRPRRPVRLSILFVCNRSMQGAAAAETDRRGRAASGRSNRTAVPTPEPTHEVERGLRNRVRQ